MNNLGGMRNIYHLGSNTRSCEVARVRDQFMMYFNEEGTIDWQFSNV